MNNQATGRQTEPGMMTGLFRDRESTEGAYQSLRERGYSDDEINVMMSDDTRKKYYGDGDSEVGNNALEGAGVGAIAGGTLGAILGGVATVTSNLIFPGLGLVLAGPIAAALAGAGAGAITGGVGGALIGWGIPEETAKHYENGIREGGTVVGVTPRSSDDADYFENEWRDRYRGEYINRV